MKSDRTKENIIRQTIDLIKETNGDTENITMRKIAERAGIGVGLANHYFHTKDYLIEVCVQTIISEVIHAFRPDLCESTDPIDITKCVAKQVMDFLMDNKQISRVSILGDLKAPSAADNTMKTVFGLGSRLSEGETTPGQLVNAFMITSVIHEAFLRKDLLKQSLGIDFYNKNERDQFLDYVVERFGADEVPNHERQPSQREHVEDR